MIELKSSVVGFHRFKECFEAVLLKDDFYAAINGGRAPVGHRITQAAYSIWREENDLPDKDLGRISPEEIEAIYQGTFWLPSHAHECPRPVDLLLFDHAARAGAKQAVQLLQEILEVPCDGIFGPVTRAAVQAADGCAIARRFQERLAKASKAVGTPHSSKRGEGIEPRRQTMKVAA